MGQMALVMERINALYQQYADGLITDGQCLLQMQRVCIEEMAGIINNNRRQIESLEKRITS